SQNDPYPAPCGNPAGKGPDSLAAREALNDPEQNRVVRKKVQESRDVVISHADLHPDALVNSAIGFGPLDVVLHELQEAGLHQLRQPNTMALLELRAKALEIFGRSPNDRT